MNTLVKDHKGEYEGQFVMMNEHLFVIAIPENHIDQNNRIYFPTRNQYNKVAKVKMPREQYELLKQSYPHVTKWRFRTYFLHQIIKQNPNLSLQELLQKLNHEVKTSSLKSCNISDIKLYPFES